MEYPQKPGIYNLINKLNGKIYIGKTNNLKRRFRDHKQSSKKYYRGKYPIVRALQKYGWHNFDVQILEYFDEIENEKLLDIEAEWIKKLDATNREKGYNICKRSTDRTKVKVLKKIKLRKKRILSKEHKRKISEACKGKNGNKGVRKKGKKRIGINNPFYGHHHSQKSKEKIKLIHLGKKCPHQEKSVKQIDKNTKEIIKIWPSITEASIALKGNKHGSSSIAQACKKYITPKGYVIKQAYGFKWEYV